MPLEPIKTPCIGICKLDIGSNRCVGCRRSTDQIAAWGAMSDEEREEIMDLLLFEDKGTEQ